MRVLVERLRKVAAHPLAKGSAIILVGSMVSNAGAYAYHLVVGRILGPVGYGELASLFSFSYLLNVPAVVLQTVLTRYVAGYKANHEVGRAKTLAFTASKWLLIVTVAGALFLVPFISSVSAFLRLTQPVSVFYMYLTSALLLLGTVETGMLQGFQLFTEAMVFANIGIALRIVGGTIGALFGVTQTVLAGVITNVIGYFLYLVPLRFVLRAHPEPLDISSKEATSYTIPTLLAILGITSLYSTDIMLAKHFLSGFDAGLYAALSVMGKIVFFASSSVVYVLFPVIAERTKQGVTSHRLVYAALGAVGLVSGAITLGYYLFPRLALLLLFGPSYFPASTSLGTFGIFISLFSLANVLVTTLLGQGSTKVWLFVVVASILQIGGISLSHDSIASILWMNIIVTGALLSALLLYYRHAIKEH